MFEAVNPPRRSRRQQAFTLMASIIAHVAVTALLPILPLLYFSDQLPKTPGMIAFVVTSAPPPPPPPPPPPASPTQKPQSVKPDTPPTQPVAAAAPVEAPATVEPERLPVEPVRELAGIEAGIAGGVAGGIAGGVPMVPAPPSAFTTDPAGPRGRKYCGTTPASQD
jgi:hypothetical protein